MKLTLTILMLLFGCTAPRVPDICRIAELEVMLTPPPPAAMPDTTPSMFERTDTDETTENYKVGDYLLIDYFRSSPPCPPCIRFDTNEKHKVDCAVKQIDTSTTTVEFVSSVPTFRLIWCSTETKKWVDLDLWTGFISADTINKAVAKHKKSREETTEAVTSCNESWVSTDGLKVRRTAAGLRQWIQERYTPLTKLKRATVNPKSFVWRHLRDDHGFHDGQVNGLPQWQALALQDASHPRNSPLVTPWVVP